MRSVLSLALCAVLLLPACKEEAEQHMSPEKMKDVLTDIHFAEIYSTMVNDSLHKTTNKNIDSLRVYYKSILEHHDITMEELQSSLHWYADHPVEMDTVYINIQNELSTIEGMLNAAKTSE